MEKYPPGKKLFHREKALSLVGYLGIGALFRSVSSREAALVLFRLVPAVDNPTRPWLYGPIAHPHTRACLGVGEKVGQLVVGVPFWLARLLVVVQNLLQIGCYEICSFVSGPRSEGGPLGGCKVVVYVYVYV